MATLAQYIAFHTLIDTGNFTETGLKLNLTQSSISHTISNLEAELGLSLIIRNRNNIVLTSEGELFYEHISKILQQQQQLETSVANLKISLGYIIGWYSTKCFIGLITKGFSVFRTASSRLTNSFDGGDYDQIEDWLHNGVVDIGF